MANKRDTILVIGASGQLGSELTLELRKMYGDSSIVASDIKTPKQAELMASGPFELVDVLNSKTLTAVASKYKFTQIYHLAAILSALGEKNPELAWHLNMDGLLNVLRVAKEYKINKIFWPSSIAVFGPHTPRRHTPQHAVMDPNTVYGISKQAGERWCAYYFEKYGLDIRSLRYPGLIGYKSPPGGGTTDYAVEIYHKALEGKSFECFLSEHTSLPMMYMPDALKAALDLMHAPAKQIRIRDSYNITAMSLSPVEIATSIQKHLPDFNVTYMPDYRQQIAASWPETIDDTAAQLDWDWKPTYNLEAMTADMLQNLRKIKAAQAAL